MSPLDETVAAPSRMFSTNIRYGRSAVDSVNTRRPDPPSETTKASTSPGADRPQRVLGLGHPDQRVGSRRRSPVRRSRLDERARHSARSDGRRLTVVGGCRP